MKYFTRAILVCAATFLVLAPPAFSDIFHFIQFQTQHKADDQDFDSDETKKFKIRLKHTNFNRPDYEEEEKIRCRISVDPQEEITCRINRADVRVYSSFSGAERLAERVFGIDLSQDAVTTDLGNGVYQVADGNDAYHVAIKPPKFTYPPEYRDDSIECEVRVRKDVFPGAASLGNRIFTTDSCDIRCQSKLDPNNHKKQIELTGLPCSSELDKHYTPFFGFEKTAKSIDTLAFRLIGRETADELTEDFEKLYRLANYLTKQSSNQPIGVSLGYETTKQLQNCAQKCRREANKTEDSAHDCVKKQCLGICSFMSDVPKIVIDAYSHTGGEIRIKDFDQLADPEHRYAEIALDRNRAVIRGDMYD